MSSSCRQGNRLAMRSVVLAGVLVGCGDEVCIVTPCPLPLAAIVSVSAINAPAGVSGLVFTVDGVVRGSGPCSQAAVSECRIYGYRGAYQVQVSAPGYATTQVNLAVTGTDYACNSCAKVDVARSSITLQPVP